MPGFFNMGSRIKLKSSLYQLSYSAPLPFPFETGAHVAQAGLKLAVNLLVLLPPASECWDFRCALCMDVPGLEALQ